MVPSQVNDYVGSFHDALILYSLAANETIHAGLDPRNGSEITRRMWNRTFKGGWNYFYYCPVFITVQWMSLLLFAFRPNVIFGHERLSLASLCWSLDCMDWSDSESSHRLPCDAYGTAWRPANFDHERLYLAFLCRSPKTAMNVLGGFFTPCT